MYFIKGQGTGRKKNKQKLTEKLSQSKDESNEGPTPKTKKNKDKNKNKTKVLKDKTGQVVQDGEGLFQVKIHIVGAKNGAIKICVLAGCMITSTVKT